MPRKSPLAAGAVSVIRASPPLKSITKASTSLTRASFAKRHYLRVLLSLIATRNLIKSFLLFRPVNRKTLKPGSPLWKVFVKAVWMAIWPSLSKSVAERVIKKPVAGGAEVQACGEESVSTASKNETAVMVVAKEEETVIAVVEDEEAKKVREAAEAVIRAARAKAVELAFQKEFAQVEELVQTGSVVVPAG